MTRKDVPCVFDYEFIKEMRGWLLYYPEHALSLNAFCNLLASPYVICSSEMLYPGDLEEHSRSFSKLQSRGIIQLQPFGASNHDAFSYSYHNMADCS